MRGASFVLKMRLRGHSTSNFPRLAPKRRSRKSFLCWGGRARKGPIFAAWRTAHRNCEKMLSALAGCCAHAWRHRSLLSALCKVNESGEVARGQHFIGLSRRRIAALVRVVWFLFLGGAGGSAGYAGPQLGPFYEIASEGVVKGQNFLGGSRRSGARACGFLGGGRVAQG